MQELYDTIKRQNQKQQQQKTPIDIGREEDEKVEVINKQISK